MILNHILTTLSSLQDSESGLVTSPCLDTRAGSTYHPASSTAAFRLMMQSCLVLIVSSRLRPVALLFVLQLRPPTAFDKRISQSSIKHSVMHARITRSSSPPEILSQTCTKVPHRHNRIRVDSCTASLDSLPKMHDKTHRSQNTKRMQMCRVPFRLPCSLYGCSRYSRTESRNLQAKTHLPLFFIPSRVRGWRARGELWRPVDCDFICGTNPEMLHQDIHLQYNGIVSGLHCRGHDHIRTNVAWCASRTNTLVPAPQS